MDANIYADVTIFNQRTKVTLPPCSPVPFAPAVSPIGVGASIEQVLIYVEVIPGELADVIRHPLDHAADGSGSVDDANGYQTLHDAIVGAEDIAARLLRHVEPQNLLFVFSEHPQTLQHVSIESPLPPTSAQERYDVTAQNSNQQSDGTQQDYAQHCAIVLCKLANTQLLQQLAAAKQQKSGNHCNCEKVTWSELQAIKQHLGNVCSHTSSISENQDFDTGAAHTPGPWKWEGYALVPESRDPQRHAVHTVMEVETFAWGFLVADHHAVEQEDKANRALIAAAPALLTALKDLIRAGHTLTSSSREWNAAHDAIAKAEAA